MSQSTARARKSVDPEELLKSFAEPTRLRLLALLSGGETCVCDLVTTLELPQPAISRHLAVLRRVGWVEARRDGIWMWYSLASASSGLHAKLLACLPELIGELRGLGKDVKRCASLRGGSGCC